MPPKSTATCIVPLNLPPRRLQVRHGVGCDEIYDPLRHMWLMLTPEEWVRQNFVAHLIADRGYPVSLMANEVGLKLNGLSRRCDAVVWSAGSGQPLMLLEFKASSVKISKSVFDQIIRYNMAFRAPYLIVSNGLTHYCCKTDCRTGIYTFLPEIPDYSNL